MREGILEFDWKGAFLAMWKVQTLEILQYYSVIKGTFPISFSMPVGFYQLAIAVEVLKQMMSYQILRRSCTCILR